MQAPQWTSGSSSKSNLPNGPSALLARSGSTRPKGALAAAVPGQSFNVNDPPASPSTSTSSADFYASSSQSDALPDYIGAPDSSAQTYRPVDPALKYYAPTHLSQATLTDRAGPSAGPSYSNSDFEPYARHAIDDSHPSPSPALLSPGKFLIRQATQFMPNIVVQAKVLWEDRDRMGPQHPRINLAIWIGIHRRRRLLPCLPTGRLLRPQSTAVILFHHSHRQRRRNHTLLAPRMKAIDKRHRIQTISPRLGMSLAAVAWTSTSNVTSKYE